MADNDKAGQYSVHAGQKSPAADNQTENQEHREWLASWKERISHIDNKLIEIFHAAKDRVTDKAEDMSIVARLKLQEWLDKTEMDDKARANWEKVKADGKFYAAQVENRIAHLVANGQIAWANLKSKVDDARDEMQAKVEEVQDKVEDKVEEAQA